MIKKKKDRIYEQGLKKDPHILSLADLWTKYYLLIDKNDNNR